MLWLSISHRHAGILCQGFKEFKYETFEILECLFPLSRPYLLSSETAAKGTGLAKSVGKEDPVELNSSLTG